MIDVKQYKKSILSFLIIFYTLLLNLSFFYYSEAHIPFHHYKEKDSAVHFPRPYLIELFSGNGSLPEKETSVISDFAKERFSFYEGISYNTSYLPGYSLSKLKMFVHRLMTASITTDNKTNSSAIPLGGHAPPIMSPIMYIDKYR